MNHTFKYLAYKDRYQKEYRRDKKSEKLKPLRINLEKSVYERIKFKKKFRKMVQ
jgi:hypothetical protein